VHLLTPCRFRGLQQRLITLSDTRTDARTHVHTHTISRTPLEKRLACRRESTCTTHNIHKREGNRTLKSCTRVNTGLHLRPRGHWDLVIRTGTASKIPYLLRYRLLSFAIVSTMMNVSRTYSGFSPSKLLLIITGRH
jgi:hypothetical protein